MKTTASILVALVAALHFLFLVLEMFLFRTRFGKRIFRPPVYQSLEQEKFVQVMAANQGLYNGFIAAGLTMSLFHHDVTVATQFQQFFLCCVIVAGLYGAWSVSWRILVVQAVPAALALIAVALA